MYTQYCAVLYTAGMYCTIHCMYTQYCAVMYTAGMDCTVQCWTALYTALYSTGMYVLHCTLQLAKVLSAVLYIAGVSGTLLHCTA